METLVGRDQRVGAGFVAGYTLAQIGAYLAFVPLLQVLLPAAATRLVGDAAPRLVSVIAILGAITASIANYGAGALSDHTGNRLGRRRIWLLAGLAAVLAAYAAIASAAGARALVVAVLLFQIGFNLLFAPLTALFADRVPDRQKGGVAAWLGLGLPLGSVIGTTLAAALNGGTQPGMVRCLMVLGGMVLCLVLPFALLVRDASPPPAPHAEATAPVPGGQRDFAVAVTGRLLVVAALALVQTYMLLFLTARLHTALSPPQMLARLIAVATIMHLATGFAAGPLSDRLGHRRLFVLGGAMLTGLALAVLALAARMAHPSLSMLLGAYLLLGAGGGAFEAIDLSLLAQLLPVTRLAGRGFGVANLANTLPQLAGAALALALLRGPAPDYATLFSVAAGAAWLGGALVLLVKRVR